MSSKSNLLYDWSFLQSQFIFPREAPSGLTCVARGDGFCDVWAEHSKVEMARLQRSTGGEEWSDCAQKKSETMTGWMQVHSPPAASAWLQSLSLRWRWTATLGPLVHCSEHIQRKWKLSQQTHSEPSLSFRLYPAKAHSKREKKQATVKRALPCVPLVLGRSLDEPVDAGLHAAHGVSPVQEVGDVSVFQSLVPAGPLCVCQGWERTQTWGLVK